MKSNLKWTVLAVAISATFAAYADEEPTPADPTETTVVYDETVNINDTRNYTTNVDDTRNYTTNVDDTRNFETNTTNTLLDINADIDANVDLTLDYLDKRHNTVINYDENVDVDRDVDSHEMSVSLKKDLSLSSDIAFSGAPTITGNIDLDSAAIAVIDNRQSVTHNYGSNSQLDNDASIGDDVGSAASGNLQFNVAAGDNNVQDNAAALSAADASFAFGLADAEIFVNQLGAANSTMNLGVQNNASVSGNAFSDAAGNIGVNVTSGNNNEQKNALAASVATSAYAQASVASNQISSGNTVTNTPLEREYYDTVQISLSGWSSGYSEAWGAGGYEGSTSGSYAGRGNAYQKDNFYLDTWSGALPHSSGSSTGHMDMDRDIQNAVMNPYAQGVGGIAFDTDESGRYRGSEEGDLDFYELGYVDLWSSLSGQVTISRYEMVAEATNSATLSDSAFARASGNIGVHVSAGTGNLQANSLSMAVAQPSTGGGGGGGGE